MPYEGEHKGIKFEPALKKSKSSENKAAQGKYNCECIKCGYEKQTDEHCSNIKCPKCGGQMRRKERPGPGQEKNSWDGKNSVPIIACQFNCEDAVQFSGESKEEKKLVRLVGYRGNIINHPYWGNLAFDLEGLYFNSEKTPGLIDHDPKMRLTYSEQKNISPETFIEGPFLSNEQASQLKKDMLDGFPFQASLYLIPRIVEQVADGQKVDVNNRILKGPGAVFRKAAILEISAVVFGAFSNTETTALSEADNNKNVKFQLLEKEINMDEQLTIETAVQFAEQYPDIYKEVFEAGKAEERKKIIEQFTAMQTVCGDDHELLTKCFAEGKTLVETQNARIEKLSAISKDLTQKLAEQQASQHKIDPAITEFNNQPSNASQTDKFDENNATDEQLTEHFNKTQELKDQFSGVKAYIAAVRHPAKT